MPCVTDLSYVSTNSLPSTLLKKTGGRKQIPFHDRVVVVMVPPSVTASSPSPPLPPTATIRTITNFEQRNDGRDDDDDDDDDDIFYRHLQQELSSVTTQSTPTIISSQQQQQHQQHRQAPPPPPLQQQSLRREVSLSGIVDGHVNSHRDRRAVSSVATATDAVFNNNNNNKSNRYVNNNSSSSYNRPRHPSPEQNRRTSKLISDMKMKSAKSSSSTSSGVQADHFNALRITRMKNSTAQRATAAANCSEMPMGKQNLRQEQRQQHLNNTITTTTAINQSDAATAISEVVGRTIPFNNSSRSVKALCSTDDHDHDAVVDKEEYDDDDRHRYMVTITTSRSTIKASGGRNDYMAHTASSPRPMNSHSFGNYSTQLPEEEEDEEEGGDDDDVTHNITEVIDVLHENNQRYSNAVDVNNNISSILLQKERDNDILSAAKSRRSFICQRSTIVNQPNPRGNDTTNSRTVWVETKFGSENNVTSSSVISRTTSQNRRSNSVSGEHFSVHSRNNAGGIFDHMSDRNHNDRTSQSKKSFSSPQLISTDIDDDIVEARRENEILSAAASRKTGRTTGKTSIHSSPSSTSQSREVLIEEHEKPKKQQDDIKRSDGSNYITTKSTTAWRKIDVVLFGDDDQSELHLFKTPAKDIAFDDLLTTTSDCSSISVSLDPSGRIIHESNMISKQQQQQRSILDPGVPNVISDVGFNRVKSVLDRMRKPMMIHTATTPATVTTTNRSGGGGMVSLFNAPKMKNRIGGTSNFVQNRVLKSTPVVVSTSRATAVNTQMEQFRNNISSSKRRGSTASGGSDDVAVIVQATSFHGDANEQDIVESVPVAAISLPTAQRPLEYNTTTIAGLSSVARKDPPANTLFSERR